MNYQNQVLKKTGIVAFLATLILNPGCSDQKDQPTLKETYTDHFYIGAAIGRGELAGRDSNAVALFEEHFNSATLENSMKWERIHPQPGVYDFETADRYVDFCEKNDLYCVGHCLIWHQQTPDWVFWDDQGNPVDRETLLERMREHINTVVGRYKGRVDAWDVVNEAVHDDGELRKTKWLEIIGEDYLQKAFEFAGEADHGALLIYNDFSLPRPEKRDGVIALVNKLKEHGVKVDAIGLQGHYNLDLPGLDILEEAITRFSDLEVEVMITELDIDVLPLPENFWSADISKRFELTDEYNPYTEELPDSMQNVLSQRYADLFKLFLKHRDKITRVTFWGITDGDSWKNNFPIRGRTNYPLLFDRNYEPKPAFDAVIEVAQNYKAP